MNLAEIRERDRQAVPRFHPPGKEDPFLQAEMDRRWLLGKIDELTKDAGLEPEDNPLAVLGQTFMDGLRAGLKQVIPPPCDKHREEQHRDHQKPWCRKCGWRHAVSEPAQKLGKSRAERDVERIRRDDSPSL